MRERLSSQDLLTANYGHRKSALSFAIYIIAFLSILSTNICHAYDLGDFAPNSATKIKVKNFSNWFNTASPPTVQSALEQIASPPTTIWTKSGTSVYTTTLTDKVGIGTASPYDPLTVVGDMTQSDANPKRVLRDSDTNTAIAEHYEDATTANPFRGLSVWEGTDNGITGFFRIGLPYYYYDTVNNYTFFPQGNVNIGGTAFITSGLTVNNAVLAGSNIVLNNNILDFDGTDDRVYLGNLSELNAPTNLSISFWLNQDILDKIDRIFYCQADSTHRLIIQTSSNGGLYIYTSNGVGDTYGYFDYSTVITAGRWHHFVMVYNGTQSTDATKLVVYVDGTAQTLTFAGTQPTALANLSATDAYISSNSSAFDGKLKRFRIYSLSLTQANVTTLYQGTDFGTNLAHYYKLDEGAGTTVVDYGSNIKNGTITGAVWRNSNYTGLGTTFPTTRLSLPAATDISSGISWGNDTWLYRSGVNTLALNSDLTFSTIGKGITLKQGTNGKCGTFVCNEATPVTISNTSIAITDCIIISLNTVGGTVGALPTVKTITAATGFTTAGTAGDTSIYNWAIISNQS